MGKPIRTLLVNIVIEKAIIFEEVAYQYYQSLLGQAVVRDTFDLFKRLSGQELQHRIMLEEMRRNIGAQGTDLIMTKKKLEIEPLSSAELDSLCDEWSVLTPEDSVETILSHALHKEQCACRFYQKMMQLSRHKDLIYLFQTLLLEEKGHEKAIEEELKKILS